MTRIKIGPGIPSVLPIDKKLLNLLLEEGQVVIHIKHKACFPICIIEGKCSISLSNGVSLQPNTGSSPSVLIHAVNAGLLGQNVILKNEFNHFTLIFSKLPNSATKFDFIEPGTFGWRLLNIKRNQSDVYKMTIHKSNLKLISS